MCHFSSYPPDGRINPSECCGARHIQQSDIDHDGARPAAVAAEAQIMPSDGFRRGADNLGSIQRSNVEAHAAIRGYLAAYRNKTPRVDQKDDLVEHADEEPVKRIYR